MKKSTCKASAINLGRYKNVFIFDLNAMDTNFVLSKQKVKASYFCDAERVSADGKFYLCNENQFEYGNTQTDKEIFSGEQACVLSELNPYGMTMKFTGLEFGESFKLRVWRKSAIVSNATIVTSINNQTFYECTIVDSALNGWQQIESKIFINENFVGNELVIYLYNPSKEPAYFDNFEITRYQSVLNQSGLDTKKLAVKKPQNFKNCL